MGRYWGRSWRRAEGTLVAWLCIALLVGSALLLWQQWRVHQARRELHEYLTQRVVPWAAEEGAAGGPGAPPGQGESQGQDPGQNPASGLDGDPDREEAGAGDRLLQVHIAGAVAAPGVYELAEGARAVDGVNAAGGAVPEADLDRINLAAPLQDGQQLYVPRRGEETPSTGAGAPGEEPPGAMARVNVNRAGVDALQQVPGIGPVLAARIVAYRQAHGPFQSVDELTRVQGIGPRSLENMRPYIYVDGSS